MREVVDLSRGCSRRYVCFVTTPAAVTQVPKVAVVQQDDRGLKIARVIVVVEQGDIDSTYLADPNLLYSTKHLKTVMRVTGQWYMSSEGTTDNKRCQCHSSASSKVVADFRHCLLQSLVARHKAQSQVYTARIYAQLHE